MDPTTNFYKTKRTLLVFSGALLLAVFAGFKIAEENQRPTFLPFRLDHPELLGVILAVTVAFYLFQFLLQWASQNSDIQNNRFHRIDLFATTFVSGLALLCYLGSLVMPTIVAFTRDNFVPDLAKLLTVSSGVISGLAVAIASLSAGTVAAKLGLWIKRKAAKEDEKLNKTIGEHEWMLQYDPGHKNALKKIVFAGNGEITKGKNQNENSWRVRHGLLEILNSEGQIFSRFSYDPSLYKFTHTNDDDTISIRSQYIFRASEKNLPS
ncbi:MAG: hypothetical protein ABI451_00660 [Dokdonella sp.]